MRKKFIGSRYFSGVVDITDPGYDKDMGWCRTSAKVKDGNYDCYVWINKEKETLSHGKIIAEKHDSKRVGIIGMYKDGIIPKQSEMKLYSYILVDAGLAGFFKDKPDYNDEEWKEFCNDLNWSKSYWSNKYGFFSETGYGDGEYPVYVKYEGSSVVAIEIRFL